MSILLVSYVLGVIIWIIIGMIVGSYGKQKSIGFTKSFLASIFLSPILAMLFVLSSKDKVIKMEDDEDDRGSNTPIIITVVIIIIMLNDDILIQGFSSLIISDIFLNNSCFFIVLTDRNCLLI